MKELQDIDLRELIEEETGERFNKDGYIFCPFHKEKTPSMKVKFFPDRNKEKYKCFGCDEVGDAIDFIVKFRNLEYKAAREYLGLENEKSPKELIIDKVRSYIDWQLKNTKKGYEFLGLFPFTNPQGEYVYFKAKFRKPDGKKETPYYHIENDKVISNREGIEEVPYNLHNVLEAIKRGYTIIFVEGEKDANNLNSILKKEPYVATSIKGCMDLKILQNGLKYKVYVVSDTGKAGEKYKWKIYEEFCSDAIEFKFINLPGLKLLGDNKDVTDWIEGGKTKKDLLNAFDRSLDLKSKFELQQSRNGVFKWWYDKKADEHQKQYITDFKIIEAKRLIYTGENKEGVQLIIKTPTGDIIERSDFSTVFDDIKSFKHFLGTMDASFTSKNIEDLTKLKMWINRYWATENNFIYLGDKFIEKDDKLILVTGKGAITSDGVDYTTISDKSNIDIMDKEFISKSELIEFKDKIFKFWEPTKSISIFGTIVNYLAVHQNEAVGAKLHVLLIIGESQSGKSTILEKVIAPILNYPLSDKKSIGTTPFAIIKDLATGNYPSIYDEFKPSMMDKYKMQKMSDIIRNLYDRQVINRGDKSFKVKSFRLTRPLIMAGEENYPNQESALISRSCIVYLSKRERTKKNTEAMEWIIDNQDILNKFGKSIINEILNLSVENYKEIRKKKRNSFKDLKERALDTAINIACGIEIYNILLKKHGLRQIKDYEDYIYKNIKEEILDNGTDTKSIIEQMIILYNTMIEDCKTGDLKNVVKETGEGLYIRTSEMLNQIFLFCKQYESADIIPLKLKDFKKQAMKSGYLLKSSSKLIKIDGKPIRFDEYSKERMRELRVDSIVSPELAEIPMDLEESKVIEGMFQRGK